MPVRIKQVRNKPAMIPDKKEGPHWRAFKLIGSGIIPSGNMGLPDLHLT